MFLTTTTIISINTLTNNLFRIYIFNKIKNQPKNELYSEKELLNTPVECCRLLRHHAMSRLINSLVGN